MRVRCWFICVTVRAVLRGRPVCAVRTIIARPIARSGQEHRTGILHLLPLLFRIGVVRETVTFAARVIQ